MSDTKVLVVVERAGERRVLATSFDDASLYSVGSASQHPQFAQEAPRYVISAPEEPPLPRHVPVAHDAADVIATLAVGLFGTFMSYLLAAWIAGVIPDIVPALVRWGVGGGVGLSIALVVWKGVLEARSS